MTRPSHDRWSSLRLKAFLFPLLMGIVGWLVLRGGMAVAPTNNAVKLLGLPTSTSSTLILLERYAPKQDRDARFIYDVEGAAVEVSASAPGWRIGSAARAQLTRRTEDGVWSVVNNKRSVVLRNQRGTLYKDPILVGAFDEDTPILIAVASDARVMFSVSRSGSIHELAVLSDQTAALWVEHDRVWLVESAPQEGIEFSPHGPSSVWSVDKTGATSTDLIDERSDRLVNRMVTNDHGEVALGTDKGDLRVFRNGQVVRTLNGQPLLWLPDGRLLLVQHETLCLSSETTLTCGPKAPEGFIQASLFTP